MKTFAGLAFLFAATLTQSAFALLQPLSEADRRAFASNVVTGYVYSVKSTVVDHADGRPEMTDRVYSVRIFVESVEKGGQFTAGEVLEFSFWKANHRPDGMTGDFGQDSVPRHQTLIRAYLIKNEDGQLELLHPNGFDQI